VANITKETRNRHPSGFAAALRFMYLFQLFNRRHFMKSIRLLALAALLLTPAILFSQHIGQRKWPIHDESRPVPKIITPGTESSQDQPGTPPSDAIVLFDGKDLSKWASDKGGEPMWKVENGYVQIVSGKGGIQTRDGFGDCQLHVEWASPNPPEADGQDRGNSGVYLMARYEVQVMDGFDNKTYADGQAAAIYGQNPPLVNASRPPGQWQTYDMIFHRPHFSADGKVEKRARITVFHNSVLVQDDYELEGGTVHKVEPKYTAHPDKAPVALQEHGHPVRYRNIWIRPLEEQAK